MNTVMLKVSAPENASTENPITMVAISKETIKQLSYIYAHIDFSDATEPVSIKQNMSEFHWLDFIDEYTTVSEKVASQIENIVEHEGLCTEFDIEVTEGVDVESPRILMDADGVYFACEHEGETYCSTLLDEEQFEYLDSLMEEAEAN